MSFQENYSPFLGGDEYSDSMSELNSNFYHFQFAPQGLVDHIADIQRKSPYTANAMARAADRMSAILASIDFETSRSPRSTDAARRHSLNGLWTGLVVARNVYDADFPIQLALNEGIPIDIDMSVSEQEYRRTVALELIEYGDRGLELVGSRNRRFLDIWRPEMTYGDDTNRRQLYDVGFGVAVMGALNIHHEILKERQKYEDDRTV